MSKTTPEMNIAKKDKICYADIKRIGGEWGMHKKKLLIADSSEEFSAALQELLEDAFSVRVCWDGKEALDTMENFRPDALILDLLLPSVDGLTVLQKTAQYGSLPTVLVVTRFASDYMIDAMEQLDVDYVMRKPCPAAAVAARLLDLMREVPLDPHQQTRCRVGEKLRELGFPTHPRGYACLREVLLENIHNPGQQVTKSLYPMVGKLCGGNAAQVERAIRCLIKKAWLYRDEEVWQELFPAKRGEQAECPSNKEFIAAFSSCILAEHREMDTYFRNIG